MACGHCDKRSNRLNEICADYLEAVERGDAEAVAAIERQADGDRELTELLTELRHATAE